MKLKYEDLYSKDGLAKINSLFLQFVKEEDPVLHDLYTSALNGSSLEPSVYDALLVQLAKLLESFLSQKFALELFLNKTYVQASTFSLIAYTKRQFVQRYALKQFQESDPSWEKLYKFKSEAEFAKEAIEALEHQTSNLKNLAKYAAWAVYSKQNFELFKLPQKIDANFWLKNVKKNGNGYITTQPRHRDGFDLTDSGFKNAKACDQSHYCILCHNQGKDSCRKGLPIIKKTGCPLDQKISQMHALKREELNLAALAVIMIDNPMVAATGHRICNDCEKSCIFQKQDPVNTPSVETNILNSVLNLPYGFEIYSLLTRWNPLDFSQPLPKDTSGYKVLVVGLGPAGFSLAHYLSRDGHKVLGIDGAKLEPLPEELLQQNLIKDTNSLYKKLDKRISSGFGGVCEYGITVRWNKNYLKILRLVLERRTNLKFEGSIRYGSQITEENYKSLGFDTVAICTGAGAPKISEIKGASLPGVRLASDFLMTLQLNGAFKDDSLTNLQILGPIIVIGGGLTAIDTATEAKAYYKTQIKKFRHRYKQLTKAYGDEFKKYWTPYDHLVAEKLLTCDEVDVRLIYRSEITNSPSYKLNHEEIEKALEEGIIFEDQTIPLRIEANDFGCAKGLWVKRFNEATEEFIEAETIIMAVGTTHDQENCTFPRFGDANPNYAGSVVKAIASAKYGYKEISQQLQCTHPVSKTDISFKAEVSSVEKIAPTLIKIEIKAPFAASNFQPGQFYRLQNFESYAPVLRNTKLTMEALALTPVKVDKDEGIITFVIVGIGSTSLITQYLKPKEIVSLMGPTGTPTELPKNQNVLLIGGGHFNLALLHLAKSLKDNGNTVFWIAAYTLSSDRTFINEIESASDHLWLFCNDAFNKGNVLDGLTHLNDKGILQTIDWFFVMGSTPMQQAIHTYLQTHKQSIKSSSKMIANANVPMQCMMQGICGQCLINNKNELTFCCKQQEWQLEEIPFSELLNRSKQNGLLEKISKKWLEYITETQEV
ncbi:MAG: FAD-dependent oxidoreductase [Proteobacteria bacterium]|nr:FAD-dependent oxidoreductase [Pseudomonadota bacterium]